MTLVKTLAATLFCAVTIPAVAYAGPPRLLSRGGVLSGELTAMKSRKTKSVTYQITSEPRRLPPPSGLCNLETGPETFQIVTSSNAEAAELKPYLGKTVSVKATEIACAEEAGQFSDAIVTKWSVVKQ